MGWPLAVANGMRHERHGGVANAGASGHRPSALAMAAAVLPFGCWPSSTSAATRPASRRRGSGGGRIYKLVDRRHPRILARIRPTDWLWSFVMATAHGRRPDAGPGRTRPGVPRRPATRCCGPCRARGFAIRRRGDDRANDGDLASGIVVAWLVYRFLGLMFMRRVCSISTRSGAPAGSSPAAPASPRRWGPGDDSGRPEDRDGQRATGYIGRALCARCSRAVIASARQSASSRSKAPAGVEVAIVEPFDSTALTASARGSDVLVHLIGTPHPNPSKAAESRRSTSRRRIAAVEAVASSRLPHLSTSAWRIPRP